MSDIIFDAKPL